MSWVQFQGETWETTDDTATLRVWLGPPDLPSVRSSWSLSLMHFVRHKDAPGPGPAPGERVLHLDLGEIGFQDSDWRRLSGHEVRADAQWQAAQTRVNCYGRVILPEVDVSVTVIGDRRADPPRPGRRTHWRGHDFILRLGTRDGLCFPCELEAWLIPKKDYDRATPESAAELACFGEGPPTLRVVTPAIFEGGSLELARCGDDPRPAARQRLRHELGFTERHELKMEWWTRKMPGAKESEPMPGWRSTVSFKTQR